MGGKDGGVQLQWLQSWQDEGRRWRRTKTKWIPLFDKMIIGKKNAFFVKLPFHKNSAFSQSLYSESSPQWNACYPLILYSPTLLIISLVYWICHWFHPDIRQNFSISGWFYLLCFSVTGWQSVDDQCWGTKKNKDLWNDVKLGLELAFSHYAQTDRKPAF